MVATRVSGNARAHRVCAALCLPRLQPTLLQAVTVLGLLSLAFEMVDHEIHAADAPLTYTDFLIACADITPLAGFA